jgi:hypothetical protein
LRSGAFWATAGIAVATATLMIRLLARCTVISARYSILMRIVDG